MSTSFLKIATRIVLVSLYAFLVMIFVKLTMPADIKVVGNFPKGVFAVAYLLLFNLNTEGNFFFNRFLNKKIPWFYFPKKRLLTQLSFILMWTIVTIGIPFTIWYFYNGRSLTYPPFSVAAFVSSIMLLLSVLGVSLAINFFQEWKTSLLKAEHYQQEKLKADYKALQNQVNPHFLFNSLNVLISEIKHNPNTAETFTRKLSQVYRYVLQSKNHDLVSLKKEVEFIRSYIYLHQVRVGNALNVSIDTNSESLQQYLPPLTIQILVENAIKHNVMNEENPLHITIESRDRQTLTVKNNLNPKQSFDSTKTGLSNIKARYELLKEGGLKIEKSETEFIVTVPLLDE